jgi:hypothetical protein
VILLSECNSGLGLGIRGHCWTENLKLLLCLSSKFNFNGGCTSLTCPATSLLLIVQVFKLNATSFKFSKWKCWTKLALLNFSNKRSRKFSEISFFWLGIILRRKRKIYFPWIFGSFFLPRFSGRVHEVLWRHPYSGKNRPTLFSWKLFSKIPLHSKCRRNWNNFILQIRVTNTKT